LDKNIGLWRAAEIKKRVAESGLSPRAHLLSEENSRHALNIVIIIAGDLCVARKAPLVSKRNFTKP
jgi:hypothetical protein